MSWQPIETAPRDGTDILAFEKVGGKDRILTMRYDRMAETFVTNVSTPGGRAMKLAGLSILALTAFLMWMPRLDPNLVHLAWAALGLAWMLLGSLKHERRRR